MYDDMHPALRKHVTICRCNNIELGTIEKAIEGGARTVSDVGRTTTATTGQCGGSCTPKVLALIESTGLTPDPERDESQNARGDEDAWWVRR